MPEKLATPEVFELGNRRYLGGKSKLLDHISQAVIENLGHVPSTFIDAFAGTGVVGAHFASMGSRVVMNDLLFHNSLAHRTFLLHKDYDLAELALHLKSMNNLDPIVGYVSKNFGGLYFSESNAQALDAAREYIEFNIKHVALKAAAITSVIYAADKIAQTVGHYDAFYRGQIVAKEVDFRLPAPIGAGIGHQIFSCDARDVVTQIEADVLYLDPPYNSRQYSDAYHLLENIATWEKPEVFGVARKMDRKHLKSDFSKRNAATAFASLIEAAQAKLIVLSYSNTGENRVSRSNNLITDEQIISTLGAVGTVKVENIDFREFSVGRTSDRKHIERLFICKVGA